MFKAANAFEPDFLKQPTETLWQAISPHYAVAESQWLTELLAIEQAALSVSDKTAITRRATQLIEQVRARDDAVHVIDALLIQYSLDTHEGIMLMCLAEALIRIPDQKTADALIRDKLSVADWQRYLLQSDSLLVNASTWGLMLTGKVMTLGRQEDGSPAGIINRLINKMGEPVVRQAVNQAMRIMGRHFVIGRTIDEALKNSRKACDKGYSYSFDMLGEAALTANDATTYYRAYQTAIETAGTTKAIPAGLAAISIKLSALHPRYEMAQKQRVMTELFDHLLALLRIARAHGVAVTIDAEEQDQLELSAQLFAKLYRHPDCQGWGGLGLAVQAYSKRALPVLCWLTALAGEQGDCIPVRLVKGAYWDNEIKLAQQKGLADYPVYTRKEATDTAYLVCARFLLSAPVKGKLYPQFASHNAHTIAAILALSAHRDFEFQRLHGMGAALYDTIVDQESIPVRIYAPVGSHKDLLPYLVRRLLENGANSSFVHRLLDAKTPIAELVRHPVDLLTQQQHLANDHIPLPGAIYGDERQNSVGINIDIASQWRPFKAAVQPFLVKQWRVGPVVAGQQRENPETTDDIPCPYSLHEVVGRVSWANATDIEQALASAAAACTDWNATAVDQRAQYLEKLADLLEDNRAELVALCHREAGKTIHDSIDEVREAVDFCRYYAVRGRELFGAPRELVGPTGESNVLYLTGRGVFVGISPWNFPLAIFLGQIVAALIAGNTVIAKPAEQTSLIAGKVVHYILQAGFPADVIHLLPGDGATIGEQLLTDQRVAGVAFTGSAEIARVINQMLAKRPGPIVPLIAETGGQNAMIVDSTALPEQAVSDILQSAFASAGQRCSALRVLFVQDDIADRIIALLQGAMAELKVGDPTLPETDVGPVIDAEAQTLLNQHIARMKTEAQLLAETPLPPEALAGCFVAPVAFAIPHINMLEKEHFGPILHVIRFKASALDTVIEQINNTGYGLTLGIHTRNAATAAYIEKRARTGNTYINRNQIGAVVGVQPFGGQGLSGTGPKAGGPHYLLRFATERTKTNNTTAIGGNATLLSLGAGKRRPSRLVS